MNPARKLLLGSAVVASTLAGGAVGATFLGTAATAATTATTATADSTAASTPHQANGKTETVLTGTDAEKATAAALAAVPGATVDRVETDADGAAYEAHVTKADGSTAIVEMDSAFKVTSIEAGGGKGGHGGHGGPHTANGITETVLTGADAEKATAAALAEVPGATVNRVETDADGAAYEAHITKADGSRATVLMDSAFKVTNVETGGK
jgi:uncharacterized membrane protein YkoI